MRAVRAMTVLRRTRVWRESQVLCCPSGCGRQFTTTEACQKAMCDCGAVFCACCFSAHGVGADADREDIYKAIKSCPHNMFPGSFVNEDAATKELQVSIARAVVAARRLAADEPLRRRLQWENNGNPTAAQKERLKSLGLRVLSERDRKFRGAALPVQPVPLERFEQMVGGMFFVRQHYALAEICFGQEETLRPLANWAFPTVAGGAWTEAEFAFKHNSFSFQYNGNMKLLHLDSVQMRKAVREALEADDAPEAAFSRRDISRHFGCLLFDAKRPRAKTRAAADYLTYMRQVHATAFIDAYDAPNVRNTWPDATNMRARCDAVKIEDLRC